MEFKKENLKYVPEKPGVYLFYDKKKRLFYVGKARNLVMSNILCKIAFFFFFQFELSFSKGSRTQFWH